MSGGAGGLTEAQTAILTRMAEGATLTQSPHGDRLWSLPEDPWSVFHDVSPCLLRAVGHLELAERGSVESDRAASYRLTPAGQDALGAWHRRR